MTSNVGASTIKKQKTVGFNIASDQGQQEYDRMKENILEELKKTFRPEFLNRIDDTIVFHSLTEENLKSITDLMLTEVGRRIAESEIYLSFTDETVDFMTKKGSDLVYGARPLRRAITKELEDTLSEAMLKGEISRGDEILVDIENDELIFSHVGKRELRVDKRTVDPKEESAEEKIEEQEDQE